MDDFIANSIIQGIWKYEYIFNFKVYQRFKDRVDEILISKGYKDLIKRKDV